MLILNTNLSSLVAQTSLKTSTNRLNQAIERMTTGFKINHASDNAANFGIVTNMSSEISSLEVAEDNVNLGLDLLVTASDTLSLIQERVQRLRDLQEQALNGTYGADSLRAINAECNALVDEINRQYLSCEYNGINLFLEKITNEDGKAEILQTVYADKDTTFEQLGITSSSFSVYDMDDNLLETYDIEADNTIDDFLNTLEIQGFSANIQAGKITVKSDEGKYIAGNLADELEISIAQQSYIVATNQISDSPVIYEAVKTSTIEETVWTTTTTSSTQTSTIWTTTTTSSTQTSTIWTTTTTSQTVTSSTDITTTVGIAVMSSEEIIYTGGNAIRETIGEYVIDGVMTSSGLTGNVFKISNEQDMLNMMKLSEAGETFEGKTFVVANNIDLAGSTFTGIKGFFEGIFDGGGYDITIDIDSGSDIVGLFESLNNATVRNLYLYGTVCESGSNGGYVGGIAGYALNSTISQVYSYADVISQGGAVYIGGLLGNIDNGGVIENCYVSCDVRSYGTMADDAMVGGIVGQIGSTGSEFVEISGVCCEALISGSYEVGGLAGEVQSTHVYINNCELNPMFEFIDGNDVTCGMFIGYQNGGHVTLEACAALSGSSRPCIGYWDENLYLVGCFSDRGAILDPDVVGCPSSVWDSSVDCYDSYYGYADSEVLYSDGIVATYFSPVYWYTTTPSSVSNLYIYQPILATYDSGTTTIVETTYAAYDTTLYQLGINSECYLQLSNQSGVIAQCVTVNGSNTLYDLCQQFNSLAAGNAEAQVTPTGKLYFDGNGTLYISGGSQALLDALHLSIGLDNSYILNTTPSVTINTIWTTTTTSSTQTSTIWTTTTTSSTQTSTIWTTTTTSSTQTSTIWTTTTEMATGNTKLKDLGLNYSISMEMFIDGSESNKYLDYNLTIAEFVELLCENGFNASFENSLLTINGVNNSYLNSIKINTMFNLGSVDRTTVEKTVNTQSAKQIYEKNLVDELGDIYAPGKISVQGGINSDANSQITLKTSFSLKGLHEFRNIGLVNNDYLAQLDDVLEELNTKQVEYGTMSNKLEYILEEIAIARENLISTRSTLRDADIAEVSSVYIQQQILQQASATLLATANQSPALALQLL